MGKLQQLVTKSLSYGKSLLSRRELPGFRAFHGLFADKIGLEIGGPSSVFRPKDILPVYARAARVDGVNFATTTLWESEIREGMTYRCPDRRVGRQYLDEASQLDRIADGTYDFVLSSHRLEYFANPIKCVAEWIRVLKPGGAILLILPDSRFTFDHRRPVTSFEHLIDDYRKDKGEDDLTHLDEILALHDLARDPGAIGVENFRARSLRNRENRALHQHVFEAALVQQILHHFGLRPLYADTPPFHIIALCTTAANGSGTCP